MVGTPHWQGPGFADAQIDGALRDLLREHRPERFPTLASRHSHRCAAAVQRTGGTAHWASVFNMPAPPPAVWTDERIEAELRRVCTGAACWPSKTEFQQAGALGVLRAVYDGHGSIWWAQRMGLPTDGLRARRGS